MVLNYTAYFDESGTHSGSDVLTVAGYISSSDGWRIFSAGWQAALTDYSLDHFHMTDFANQAPPFDAWTESKRRECLGRLIKIINETAFGSVAISLSPKSFDVIFSVRAKAICGGAYGLATSACFLDLAESLRSSPEIDGWIAYVFESGAAGAGQVSKVFTANERDPKSKEHLRLLSLRFENKRQFLPLQAADILAYELHKDIPRWLGARSRPRRFPLKALASVPPKWGYLDDDELKRWAEVLSHRAALEDQGLLRPL